VVLKMIIY